MKKWICALCTIALLLVTCSGCAGGKAKSEFQPGEDLLLQASSEVADGELVKQGFTGGAGASYTVSLPQPRRVNTVILREKGENAKGFTIEAAQDDGTFQTIYEQDDTVGSYRYCAFPAVTTSALRVTLLGGEKPAEITHVEAYDVAPRQTDDFRVTTYITVEQAYDPAVLAKQAGSLELITDIIFFGSTRFDENGALWFNDIELDGRTVDGTEAFHTALENLKALLDSRQINLYCNFIGPDAPEGTPGDKSAKVKCDLHNQAMKDNRAAFAANLIDFTQQNGFNGIFFDYEYPRSFQDWRTFGQFLETLREEIDGRWLLGAAMPVWKNLWIPMVMKSLDMAEVMGYDAFDGAGYHAAFSSTASDLIGTYQSLNAPLDTLDLGMPFYARPTDGASFWFDYSWEAHALGKSHNIATGPAESADWSDGGVKKTRDVPRYYNGYQMIYDKTAYAIDAGLGGVMTWNYGYDLPYEDELSLFRAIKQAIDDRTA